MKQLICLSTILLLAVQLVSAQVKLANPSFEDEPQDATVPTAWHPCGKGSTPDILPGFWGVYAEPSDGNSYMGLITRNDGSFESIGQQLDPYLDGRTCYTLNIDLAHSRSYSGYNLPLQLRIWGGRKACKREQLLAETDFIENTDWETYSFDFTTAKHVKYIILEVQSAPGVFFGYQGNMLLDNCSVINHCQRAERVIELELDRL